MTDDAPPHAAATPGIPLPAYHTALLEYLKQEHHDLWEWFASHPMRREYADSVRLTLLRSAYRIDRDSDSTLYRLADEVAAAMQVNAAVILYQAQNPQSPNASLAWLPDEAHIVLHGNLPELLNESELKALFAHEFAHHELYAIDASAFLTVEQVLHAMTTERSGAASHDRTWRIFQLYTELYCDRRAVDVVGRVEDVIGALVKLDTGVQDISATAYLAQAKEILLNAAEETEGDTHPEMYIRAHALAAWQADPVSADAQLRPVIEGPVRLTSLDLLRQQRLTELTEQWLREFLKPSWLQTPVMLGHVKRFFADFTWARHTSDLTASALTIEEWHEDPQLKRYLLFLLLDCVTVDPDLEDAPLAAAFLFADAHRLNEPFEELARAELRLGKRHLHRIRSHAADIVATAEKELAE